jgi:hypothetical protein
VEAAFDLAADSTIFLRKLVVNSRRRLCALARENVGQFRRSSEDPRNHGQGRRFSLAERLLAWC